MNEWMCATCLAQSRCTGNICFHPFTFLPFLIIEMIKFLQSGPCFLWLFPFGIVMDFNYLIYFLKQKWQAVFKLIYLSNQIKWPENFIMIVYLAEQALESPSDGVVNPYFKKHQKQLQMSNIQKSEKSLNHLNLSVVMESLALVPT